MTQGRLNHPVKVAQLEALGGEIYAPHTWQSFADKIPFHAVTRLRSLPFAHWAALAPGTNALGRCDRRRGGCRS